MRIALRSRVAQRILVETLRAARLEMGSPEDRVPHQDPPHEAQAPPSLHTLAARCPQLPGSFWARIRRDKVNPARRLAAASPTSRGLRRYAARRWRWARSPENFSDDRPEPVFAGFCSGK